MTNFDLTPLIRTSIGFDRLADMVDVAMRSNGGDSYPPYNIVQAEEDLYCVTLAVAGFREEDIKITLQSNTLFISGRAQPDHDHVKYLHRGIAGRAFEKQFQLADFIRIEEASLADGLLTVFLRQEIPEAMKPREIKINSKGSTAKLIESE